MRHESRFALLQPTGPCAPIVGDTCLRYRLDRGQTGAAGRSIPRQLHA